MEERIEGQEPQFNKIKIPEFKEDFGSSRAEEIGRKIFGDLLGEENVEKATPFEDKVARTPTSERQPKVDFWTRIPDPKGKELPLVVGIQWTFTTSPERDQEKQEDLSYNNGFAYKEKRPEAKIQTDQPCTVVLIEVDKKNIEKLDQLYSKWRKELQEKFIDKIYKSPSLSYLLPNITKQFISQLKPTERQYLEERFHK